MTPTRITSAVIILAFLVAMLLLGLLEAGVIG